MNPFIFTQSIYSRPSLLSHVFMQYESQSGKIKNSKSSFFSWITSLKPAYKISLKVAMKKLREFISLYVTGVNKARIINEIARLPINVKTWMTQVGLALYLAKVKREQEAVMNFLRDTEKMIFLDQISHIDRHRLLCSFAEHGSNAKINLLENYRLWLNLLTTRGFRDKIFYESSRDFFAKKNKKTKLGSFLTACSLRFKNKNLFYHPDGVMGYYRAIVNSTPYFEDLDASEGKE